MQEEYQECYIAFIDILGFKSLIRDKKCSELIRIYESIKAMRYVKEIDLPSLPEQNIHIKVMSDSVCIFIPSDLKGSLQQLVFMCLDFQSRMFEMNPPVLLRGAIVKGLIYSKDDVIFGSGFVDAYLMEENNANVPRIIINKSIIDDYKTNDNEFFDSIVVRDFDAFYYLDYISAYGLNNRNNIGRYDKLYEYICSVLDNTTDDSIRNKYLYLESKVLPLLDRKKRNIL